MLRTYSKSITATANTPIILNTNKILTGTSITHTTGSSNIVVNTPGYYMITVDTNLTATSAGTETINLYAGDEIITDAFLTTTLVASEPTNASFTTIIYAKPGSLNSNVILTLVPTLDLSNLDIAVGINRLG